VSSFYRVANKWQKKKENRRRGKEFANKKRSAKLRSALDAPVGGNQGIYGTCEGHEAGSHYDGRLGFPPIRQTVH